MIICSCEAISKKEIEQCIKNGCNTVIKVGEECFAGTDCGGCRESIMSIIKEQELFRVKEIASKIQYKDWTLRVERDNSAENGRVFLQWIYDDNCVIKGDYREWHCRKWYLSPYMLESEIVNTAFAAALAAEEHDAREKFKYKDVRLFNPHISLEALMEVAHRETTRERPIDEDS